MRFNRLDGSAETIRIDSIRLVRAIISNWYNKRLSYRRFMFVDSLEWNVFHTISQTVLVRKQSVCPKIELTTTQNCVLCEISIIIIYLAHRHSFQENAENDADR